MAENEQTNGAAAGAEAPPQPRMKILGQFVRDMSFENIVAQKGIGGEVQPDIQVAVSLDAKKRPTEGQYEVIQKYKVTSKAKDGDAVLFVLELEYSGIYQIENVPDDQIHPYLLIECPRMLFPFVRRIVHDVTRDGGFPALNLENVDFLALYRQEITRRAQAEAATQTPS